MEQTDKFLFTLMLFFLLQYATLAVTINFDVVNSLQDALDKFMGWAILIAGGAGLIFSIIIPLFLTILPNSGGNITSILSGLSTRGIFIFIIGIFSTTIASPALIIVTKLQESQGDPLYVIMSLFSIVTIVYLALIFSLTLYNKFVNFK